MAEHHLCQGFGGCCERMVAQQTPTSSSGVPACCPGMWKSHKAAPLPLADIPGNFLMCIKPGSRIPTLLGCGDLEQDTAFGKRGYMPYITCIPTNSSGRTIIRQEAPALTQAVVSRCVHLST